MQAALHLLHYLKWGPLCSSRMKCNPSWMLYHVYSPAAGCIVSKL